MDVGFQEIMDLEDHPNKEEQYCVSQKEFFGVVTKLPPQDRLEKRLLQTVWGKSFAKKLKPSRNVDLTYNELQKTTQCRLCWLYPEYCVCNAMKKATQSLPFSVISLLNYSEFRRGSNTVKIISATLQPDCCTTLLYPYSGLSFLFRVLITYFY